MRRRTDFSTPLQKLRKALLSKHFRAKQKNIGICHGFVINCSEITIPAAIDV